MLTCFSISSLRATCRAGTRVYPASSELRERLTDHNLHSRCSHLVSTIATKGRHIRIVGAGGEGISLDPGETLVPVPGIPIGRIRSIRADDRLEILGIPVVTHSIEITVVD